MSHSATAIEAVVAGFGVPYEFAEPGDLPDVKGFGELDPAWLTSAWVGQRLKTLAAVEMMRRHELLHENFDVVIRLRPDLCISGRHFAFFEHAFKLDLHCRSAVVYRQKDAVLIAPRWAMDVVADEWKDHLHNFQIDKKPTNATCLLNLDLFDRLQTIDRAAQIRRPNVGCVKWS